MMAAMMAWGRLESGQRERAHVSALKPAQFQGVETI